VKDDDLIAAAIGARERAYAPYSGFGVGAALLSADGQVFTGSNIENISFGLTMCAERVAVGTAVQAGVSQFSRIAIVAATDEPIVPCGACRQVLAEFNGSMSIISSNLAGRTAEFELGELLPLSRQGILGSPS
jgi:cytidine deaminase